MNKNKNLFNPLPAEKADKNIAAEDQERKYAENLASLNRTAERTARNINYSLDILVENLEVKVQKIKLMSSQAVYAISEISVRTKLKIITFGAGMFFAGVFTTCGLYNIFVDNVMNRYLHKTIETLAEKPVKEAQLKAEKIVRDANIKADGMLKNARKYSMQEDEHYGN